AFPWRAFAADATSTKDGRCFKEAAGLPRGRPPIGPPTSLSAPRRPADPDALIDAAVQGLVHDACVRTTWPKRPARGSWIDSVNRPQHPRRRGRPTVHPLRLLARAVALLQTQRQWTQYRARRHVADRCLALRRAWQL